MIKLSFYNTFQKNSHFITHFKTLLKTKTLQDKSTDSQKENMTLMTEDEVA